MQVEELARVECEGCGVWRGFGRVGRTAAGGGGGGGRAHKKAEETEGVCEGRSGGDVGGVESLQVETEGGWEKENGLVQCGVQGNLPSGYMLLE